MIGFNHLGQHGRLGNQMFQFAFGEYLKSQGISVYYSTIWNFANNKELPIFPPG